MTVSRDWRGACLLALAALAGCGDARVPIYPVRGRVLFADGEPVRSGTIELQSLDHGTTAAGAILPDGSFVLGTYETSDGAAPGPQQGIVVQLIVADGLTRHVHDHGRRVDPRYGQYATSGLTLEVRAAAQNDLVVTLEAPVAEAR